MQYFFGVDVLSLQGISEKKEKKKQNKSSNKASWLFSHWVDAANTTSLTDTSINMCFRAFVAMLNYRTSDISMVHR